MKFEDLDFKSIDHFGFNHNYGVQAWVTVGHYKVSIVRSKMSYGGTRGLYEMGFFDPETNDMVEVPGISEPGDTVVGFLTETMVEEVLESLKLMQLPQ